jgi:hypothetical protein
VVAGVAPFGRPRTVLKPPAPRRTSARARGARGAERPSQNHLLFREVNERIREVADTFGVLNAAMFVCECGRGDCADAVELDLHEYDHVRSRHAAFVILPGHGSSHEQVIARHKRYIMSANKIGTCSAPTSPVYVESS